MTLENRRPLTKRDKAIARAQQLGQFIALSKQTDSDNEDEVKSAIVQLNQIIGRYGISPHELKQTPDGGLARKDEIVEWQFAIDNKYFAGPMKRDAFSWIGDAYGVRVLAHRRKTEGKNTQGHVLKFFGPKSVIDMVQIAIVALAAYAENRMQVELATKRAELRKDPWLSERDRQRQADQWAKGWWHAFGAATATKIRATRKHAMDDFMGSAKKGELVRQSDADRINAFIHQLYGDNIREASSGRTQYAADALKAGTQAGREALVGQDELKRNGEDRPQIS